MDSLFEAMFSKANIILTALFSLIAATHAAPSKDVYNPARIPCKLFHLVVENYADILPCEGAANGQCRDNSKVCSFHGGTDI
jgi:hypothetical protein